MRILGIFLAVSLTLHILAIFLLPGFAVMASRPLEIIPITVEVRSNEIKKLPPISSPLKDKKNVTELAKKENPKAVKEDVKKSVTPPPTPSAPKTDEKLDFKAPEVDPNLLTAVESDISANMNRLIDNTTKDKVKDDNNYVSRFVSEQLAGAGKNEGAKSNTASEVGREINAASGNVDSNFINFDVYPANNRAMTYAPPKPDFSLPNDTSIKVKFHVDGNGSVYDIILVTRNVPQVEKIASDYVKNLKFAANGNNDEAQITLTFKVRGK